MVSDSNPGPSNSPTSDPKRPVTTPINTGSRTLYRFGDSLKNLTCNEIYSMLAGEMLPYFIGPMPVADFLSNFLPLSELSLPNTLPSFTKGMFESVLTQSNEAGMYAPFVCPRIILFYLCLFYLSDERSQSLPIEFSNLLYLKFGRRGEDPIPHAH